MTQKNNLKSINQKEGPDGNNEFNKLLFQKLYYMNNVVTFQEIWNG
jgi:hypothetical protein